MLHFISLMPSRGKFIVFEGIDGSGKRTQLELLARALDDRGLPFERISFPRYDRFFGSLVAKFLNGEYGSLEDVDPYLATLLYAGDRFEAKPQMEAVLGAGKMLIADRYVASNLAHQGARVPDDAREEFLGWIKKLEYEVYAIPAEDLVIYLRVPPAAAQRQVGEKGARDYTKMTRDILESNLRHLTDAAEVYDSLAEAPNWMTVQCFDEKTGAMRAPEEIHREIASAIESRLLAPRMAR